MSHLEGRPLAGFLRAFGLTCSYGTSAFFLLCTFLLLPRQVYSRSSANDLNFGYQAKEWTPPPSEFSTQFIPLRNNTFQEIYMLKDRDASKIERIVITMSGHDRNPGTYAGHIQAALQGAMSGNATGNPPAIDGAKVQLITPAFYALADQTHGALPSPDPHNRLCFLGDEWAWGSNSVCGDPAMTSYDAMDQLFAWLLSEGQFPALRNIVLSGHSLGGFFVQTYALMGNPMVKPGVEVQYWIGNPAAYVFFDPWRSAAAKTLRNCPTYDTWPFGFGGDFNTTYRNGTMPSIQTAWRTHNTRYIHYATGLADHWPGDLGCEGLIQGTGHRDRAFAFFSRIDTNWGGISANTTIDYLPGLGHNPLQMMVHPYSVFRLFFASEQDGIRLPSQNLPADGSISHNFDPKAEWHSSETARADFRTSQLAATQQEQVSPVASQTIAAGTPVNLTAAYMGTGDFDDDDEDNYICANHPSCTSSGHRTNGNANASGPKNATQDNSTTTSDEGQTSQSSTPGEVLLHHPWIIVAIACSCLAIILFALQIFL